MKRFIITGAEVVETNKSVNNNTETVLAEGGEGMQVSDGFHTLDEVYEHRISLFIALCKVQGTFSQFATALSPDKRGHKVWRSKKHHADDKPMYEGWFVMGINVEDGKQITYHLPLWRWEETNFVEELECAPKWDGHTPADVLERLKTL